MYLMKCGHISNATDGDGKPVCVICYGTPEAEEVISECEGHVGLYGRKARCIYGDTITDSKWELPFFKYCPDKEYDEYYCSCMGWD
jgi:hypothetical protein